MSEKLVDISNMENVAKEISLLPTGLSNPSNPLNIGQSQQRAIYYRPVDNGEWHATTPLPADGLSVLHYLGKGFRTKMPAKAK